MLLMLGNGKNTAAYLAANYEWTNGQKGGSLPSKDELNALYDHKADGGGFASVNYLRSSENDRRYAQWPGHHSKDTITSALSTLPI